MDHIDEKEEKFVRVATVAKFLGMHKITLWEWARAGQIPHYRVALKSGRAAFLFRMSEIRDWLAKIKEPFGRFQEVSNE